MRQVLTQGTSLQPTDTSPSNQRRASSHSPQSGERHRPSRASVCVAGRLRRRQSALSYRVLHPISTLVPLLYSYTFAGRNIHLQPCADQALTHPHLTISRLHVNDGVSASIPAQSAPSFAGWLSDIAPERWGRVVDFTVRPTITHAATQPESSISYPS